MTLLRVEREIQDEVDQGVLQLETERCVHCGRPVLVVRVFNSPGWPAACEVCIDRCEPF